MDGLVGSVRQISALVTCIQINAPFPIWALEGSLLAFLIFNWSPAKVFMGDVGSTFLGGIFAGLNLQLNSWTIALAILLINGPLLCDSFTCLLRRIYAGHRIFQPHRLHLFQRLHRAGMNHSQVSLLGRLVGHEGQAK